ncbi:MAG TPA: glycosyltransferase, partial [Methylomirabilota bacterium]|nr:glycosyltransferase [Methylomirabilota bacterium]
MWKRNQSMVAALARRSWIRRALFLNPDVWVGALARQPRRQLTGMARFAWRGVRLYRAAPKTDVFTVCHWPFAGRVRVVDAIARGLAERVVGRYTADPYVLLVNRPADPESPLVGRLFEGAALRVFDWSDDFEEFEVDDAARARLRGACDFFLRRSDLVLAVNERLARRAREVHPAVRLVRNATHYDILCRGASPGLVPAAVMRRIPRPVIGYMGWLNPARLDTGLLEAIVEARSAWSLVFLGPATSDRPLGDRLRKAPNVHRLPPVPYDALPRYLSAFDVCILPNRINAHTDGNDPLKIYDYLATGKPIVATPTAGTEGLEGVLRLAPDAPSFIRAVEDALGERDDALVERRQALARLHSWDVRVAEVAA